MRYLLYSLVIMGGFTSFSQQETTENQANTNSVITERTTSGNVTIETKRNESKLTIQHLSRPEKVKKEAVIEEEKKENPTLLTN